MLYYLIWTLCLMVKITGFIIAPTLSTKSDISDYHPNVRNSDKGEVDGFSKGLLTSIPTPQKVLPIPACTMALVQRRTWFCLETVWWVCCLLGLGPPWCWTHHVPASTTWAADGLSAPVLVTPLDITTLCYLSPWLSPWLISGHLHLVFSTSCLCLNLPLGLRLTLLVPLAGCWLVLVEETFCSFRQ